MNNAWLEKDVAVINSDWLNYAKQKQDNLTKPPGSLGMLEQLAIRFSAFQGCAKPGINTVQIVIFAADHGIAAEGVSAFPQAVTVEMVRNFARGGAAISVLAKELGADLEVINLGTVAEHEALGGVIDQRISAGTANFSQQPAMSEQQLATALQAGREAVQRARQSGAQLFIGGDMGIANTTAASALACALLNASPEQLAGPGTGLDQQGVDHKAAVIKKSIEQHSAALDSPLRILQHLGGYEIAALTGAYIAAAQAGLPVLVDGFITGVAALFAVKIQPAVKQWMLFSHASAEPGHVIIMQALNAKPLLDFGMRLGEGSGAATVVPLIRLACALHNGMATFEQAGVSNKE